MDLCFGTHPDKKGKPQHSYYVAMLKEDLQKAYRMAEEVSNKTHLCHKKVGVLVQEVVMVVVLVAVEEVVVAARYGY